MNIREIHSNWGSSSFLSIEFSPLELTSKFITADDKGVVRVWGLKLDDQFPLASIDVFNIFKDPHGLGDEAPAEDGLYKESNNRIQA